MYHIRPNASKLSSFLVVNVTSASDFQQAQWYTFIINIHCVHEKQFS